MLRQCASCHEHYDLSNYTPTNSIFYPDGFAPICDNCINRYLSGQKYSWDAIDRVCRWLDIPFIVSEWERHAEGKPKGAVWSTYSRIFSTDTYKSLGWKDYHNQYLALRESGEIEFELPLLGEKKLAELRRTWGDYTEDEYLYLEDLYAALTQTQNVVTGLQIDQARKVCKISLQVNRLIDQGSGNVDKFLGAYDKIIKSAEFTPKTAKNSADFDSFSELALWLEKRGHLNSNYDGVTRDEVDETLKNIQTNNQRLYVNEGGLGEAITERAQLLQTAQKREQSLYNLAANPAAVQKYDDEFYSDFDPNLGGDADE